MEYFLVLGLLGIPIAVIAIRAGFNPVVSVLLTAILSLLPFGLVLAILMLAFRSWPKLTKSTPDSKRS